MKINEGNQRRWKNLETKVLGKIIYKLHGVDLVFELCLYTVFYVFVFLLTIVLLGLFGILERWEVLTISMFLKQGDIMVPYMLLLYGMIIVIVAQIIIALIAILYQKRVYYGTIRYLDEGFCRDPYWIDPATYLIPVSSFIFKVLLAVIHEMPFNNPGIPILRLLLSPSDCNLQHLGKEILFTESLFLIALFFFSGVIKQLFKIKITIHNRIKEKYNQEMYRKDILDVLEIEKRLKDRIVINTVLGLLLVLFVLIGLVILFLSSEYYDTNILHTITINRDGVCFYDNYPTIGLDNFGNICASISF